MRFRLIGFLVAFWSAAVFAACSTPPAGSTGTTTGTTGAGGAPQCEGLFFIFYEDAGNPCNACVLDKCCAELAACPTEHCLMCADYGGDPCCGGGCGDTKSPWNVLRTCAGTLCQPICFPTCVPGFCPDAGDGGG